MEEDVRIRIKTILSIKGYTPNKLANGDAAMQNRLSRQLRNASITADTICRVLNAFPDVSAEWLLRGVGVMQKSQENGKTINVYRQGGDGEGQTNVVGDGNDLSDKEALMMALKQNQMLIDALLNGK